MKLVDENQRYRAPALDKGLDILELLASIESGMSQIEIAKALQRSSNEIYRMLDRLVRRGYVLRTDDDRYELTLKLFELAHARPPIQRLVNQSVPVMRRFARAVDQACHLVIHDRSVLVVAAQCESPSYWGVSVRVGSHISLVNTGSGHVFLAFSSPAERDALLGDNFERDVEQITPALNKRLAKVREQGFESMRSLQISGVTDLSVPILGPLGNVLAALTCPYTERLDNKAAPGPQRVLELLIATGKEITRQSRGQ